jgi:hypothetical protein
MLKSCPVIPSAEAGLGRRENAWLPDNVTQSPNLCGTPMRRKSHQRVGNTRGAGSRFFVWVAEVGWTHRASSAPEGRKALW